MNIRSLADKYMGSAAFVRSPPGETGAASPDSSGGTPAPDTSGGAAPTTSPAAPSSESAAGDFSSFGDDDFDSVDLGTPTEVVQEPPAAPATAAPATPAPATPAAPATPVAAPAAPTSQEAAPSAPPQSEMDTLVQSVDTNAAALTDWLAQNAFALSKEEADAFELDAVANVPKLMARVAVNNMKSTMNIVKNLVPKMIAAEVAKISSSQTKSKEALDEFYSSNPHLNAKDHGALVTKWANAFRAANPKASRKEAIEYVGRAVSFEAGITPGTPAAPRAAPFAPARPGARQPIATTTENPSPFAALGMDLDE